MKKAIPIITATLIVPALAFDIWTINKRNEKSENYQTEKSVQKNSSSQETPTNDVNDYVDRFQTVLEEIRTDKFQGDDMGLKSRIFVTNSGSPADISKFKITTNMEGIHPTNNGGMSMILGVKRQYENNDLREYEMIVEFDSNKNIESIRYFDGIS